MSDQSPATDPHTQGVALFRAGQLDEARRAFETALAEAQATQNTVAVAEATNDLGVTLQKLKQRDDVRKQFETAIALFAELGDDQKRAQVLGNLGTLLADMKKFRDAEIRLEQAAEIFRRLGDQQNESLSLKWLSRAHLQHGDFLGAIFAYERALARLEPLPPDQALLRKILQIPLRILARG